MRFVDKVVEVADVKISAQLLDILEAHFMHQTLKKRLLVGSEVQHVGVMEVVRGLFEPDPNWMGQGRMGRRLQQPQLVSLIASVIVDSSPGSEETGGILKTLIERIDSMSDEESVTVLQLFLTLLELHDKEVVRTLVKTRLQAADIAAPIAEVEANSAAFGEALESLETKMTHFMEEPLVEGTEDEQRQLDDAELYRKDAIRTITKCFRSCELWSRTAAPDPPDGEKKPVAFLDAVLAKLSSFFRNTWQVNVILTGIVIRLLAYPDSALHLFLASEEVSSKVPQEMWTITKILDKIGKEAKAKVENLPANKLKQARIMAENSKATKESDDPDEAKLLQT